MWQRVCVPFTSFVFPQLVWNVYMHQYMYLCQPGFWILFHPLCIVIWKHGCQCVALCVSSSHCPCGPTSWIEGVHASIHGTSVCLTPNVCFIPFAYLHGKMGSSVWHCLCLPVFYFWSHTLFNLFAHTGKYCTCSKNTIRYLNHMCKLTL